MFDRQSVMGLMKMMVAVTSIVPEIEVVHFGELPQLPRRNKVQRWWCAVNHAQPNGHNMLHLMVDVAVQKNLDVGTTLDAVGGEAHGNTISEMLLLPTNHMPSEVELQAHVYACVRSMRERLHKQTEPAATIAASVPAAAAEPLSLF